MKCYVHRDVDVGMRRKGSSPIATSGMLIVGIVIGAALIFGTLYATGSLSARTVTQTPQSTTVYVTTPTYVTSTVTHNITATVTTTFTTTASGTFVSSAQVSATPIYMTAAVANAASAAPTCHAVSGAATPYILLSDTGTASATANSMTIKFGGNTYSLTPASGCPVTAGSTEVIQITGVGGSGATIGEQFNGYVSMSNGASVLFSGTFQ